MNAPQADASRHLPPKGGASELGAARRLLVNWRFWLATRPVQTFNQESAIAGLRAQLQQLAALHHAGELDDAAYTEAKAGLERRIVEAVVNPPEVTVPARRSASKALPIGLALFAGLVAVAGYLLFGTPKALNPAVAPAPAAAAASGMAGGHPVDSAQIEGMIDKLAARLKDRPQDVDGWAMLGRSYAVLGRHAQAVPAFEKAVALRPDDAVLLADYADALRAANGRSMEGAPGELIARALKIDPNNLKALSLAGTAAFDRKDYSAALLHWDKLVRLAPDSPFAQQIRAGIDEARKQTGGPPMAPAARPSVQRVPAAGA